MVSIVKERPNHYETLGLKPTASDDDIKQAFARQMRLPHRMPELAQIGIAFDTLRDPSKRRAHDQALGLANRPKPRQWAFVAQARWSPSVGSGGNPIKQTVGATLGAPEPFVTAKPEAKLAPEARGAQTEWAREPEAPEPGPRPGEFRERRAKTERPRAPDNRPVDWKYPLVAVGGLLVAAGLLGAWAGTTAGSDAEAAQAAVTVALPKARPHTNIAAPPAASAVEAQAEWPGRPAASLSRTRRLAARRQSAAWTQQQVAESPPAESEPAGVPSDPLAPEPAAKTIAARMPLPGKLIARTIERIGYSCSEVSATAAAEGAGPGVYNVTCSSGETYQATPVHGRYRFRRSGGK